MCCGVLCGASVHFVAIGKKYEVISVNVCVCESLGV